MKQHFLDQWESEKPNLLIKLESFLENVRSGLLKIPDQKVQNIHDQIFEEINCLECANCCKTTPALLTGPDIKRIAKFLKMPPKIFNRQYLLEDVNGEMSFRKVPCVFLEKDNWCSIYEVRPESCQDYPHTGSGSFRKRAGLHKENLKVCPAAFEIIKRLEKP